jgi:hypothetical protein
MDQSLFAAPHGLSQRITSFIACACQGIHQLPFRHLIVLIANDHLEAKLQDHLSCPDARSAPDGPPNDWRRPFGLAELAFRKCPADRTKHLIIDIRYRMDQRIHTFRPASRDMRTDVRSATSTRPSARQARRLEQLKRSMTGKALSSSSRMSSLHDVVKNRPFIPGYEVQTSFFLIRIITHLDTQVVELSGIEPLTPCLQSRCSPS